MSTSRTTLLFAACVYVFYCFAYHVAGRFYPTVLWLEVFPYWIMAIGFAFITIPFAYFHCAVIGALVRNAGSIDSRATGRVYTLSVSMTVLLVAGLAWLHTASLNATWGYGGVPAFMAPDSAAFTTFNARINLLIRNGIPLIA
ncbi:MAG: hypothetical protein GY826_23510, partial [Fuerstiella sp.]|nr:hypothetical protein [Fuerstiella sp.]